MALIYPIEVSLFKNKAEEYVYEYLKNNLPDKCICYYNYYVEEKETDFIILIPEYGIAILEVKNWSGTDITEVVDNNKIKYRRNGENREAGSPLSQCRNYCFSLIRSQRRNGLIKKEELRGIGATFAIGIITEIIYYVGPSIQQTTQNNVQQIQPVQQTTTTDKNEIVEEMNACMELTSLYNPEVMAGFKMINKLFAYKLDKQMEKEFEDMKRIDNIYQDAIREILDRTSDASLSSVRGCR